MLITASPSCVVAGSVERHANAASIASIVAVKPNTNRHGWHGVSGRALLLAGREERGNGNWPIASGVSRRLDLGTHCLPGNNGKRRFEWMDSRITIDFRNLEKVVFPFL
jgi:hypothetical protein